MLTRLHWDTNESALWFIERVGLEVRAQSQRQTTREGWGAATHQLWGPIRDHVCVLIATPLLRALQEKTNAS